MASNKQLIAFDNDRQPTEFDLAMLPRQDFIDWMVRRDQMSASQAGEVWDNHAAREYRQCECGEPVKAGNTCLRCLAAIAAIEAEGPECTADEIAYAEAWGGPLVEPEDAPCYCIVYGDQADASNCPAHGPDSSRPTVILAPAPELPAVDPFGPLPADFSDSSNNSARKEVA